MHTGEVIRYLRKKNNLTQEELAKLLDVKKASIQKYESGKVQNLKHDKIQKLCEIFCVMPFALIFPKVWKELQMPRHNDNNYLEYAKIYCSLNEDGKQKLFDYLEDIGQIERYRQKDKPLPKAFQNKQEDN